MGAVAVWTWVGAVVLALVIMAFCAYEIVWKIRRLGRDVESLQQLQTQLASLQGQVASAQATAVTIQQNRAARSQRNGDMLFPHPRDARPADSAASA